MIVASSLVVECLIVIKQFYVIHKHKIQHHFSMTKEKLIETKISLEFRTMNYVLNINNRHVSDIYYIKI